MPFCHNCGNRVKDKTKFCNKCGTKLRQQVSAQHTTSSFSRQERIKPSFDNVLEVKKSKEYSPKEKTPAPIAEAPITEVDSQISDLSNYNEFQIIENNWFNFTKKTVMLQRLSSYLSYLEDVKKEIGEKLRETRSKRYQVKKEYGKSERSISFKELKSDLKDKRRGVIDSLPLQLIIINERINFLDDESNLLEDNLAQAKSQGNEIHRKISSDQSEGKFTELEKMIFGSAKFTYFKDSFVKLKNNRKRETILINDLEDILAAIVEVEKITEHLNNLSEVLSACERISSSYYQKDELIQSLIEREEIQNARREMIQIKLVTHKTNAYLNSLSNNSNNIDLSFIDMNEALESFIEDTLSNQRIRFKSNISSLVDDIVSLVVDIQYEKASIDEEIASIKISTDSILDQLKIHTHTTSELFSSLDITEDQTEISSEEVPTVIEQITIDEVQETVIASDTESDLLLEEISDPLSVETIQEIENDKVESPATSQVPEKVIAINLSSDLEVERSINQQLRYSSRKIEKIGNEIHVTLMSGDIKTQLWVLKEETIEISGEGTATRSDISLEIHSKNREGSFNWSDPWKNIELSVHEDYLSALEGRRLIAEQIYKLEGEVKIVFSRSSKIVNIFLVVAKTAANVKAASQTFKEIVYLSGSI